MYISAYMQKNAQKREPSGPKPAVRQDAAQDALVRHLADACDRLARIERLLGSMLGVK